MKLGEYKVFRSGHSLVVCIPTVIIRSWGLKRDDKLSVFDYEDGFAASKEPIPKSYTMTVRIGGSSKGSQIFILTIPAPIRKRLHLKPGDVLECMVKDNLLIYKRSKQ